MTLEMYELRPRRRHARFALLLIIVATATASVHWPALSAKAICFDDRQYVLDNRLIKNPSAAAAWTFLSEVTAPSTVVGYYQPLAMISLMLDTAMGGRTDNLRPFHRTSLVLHVLNACLVAALLFMLFGEPWSAAGVGLLFGLHPLTVEPIPWLGERKTLLCTFFSLLSLCAYVRWTRGDRREGPSEAKRFLSRRPELAYAASLVFFLAALLSKPTGTPLPLVMLLIDIWPLRRFGRRAIIEKWPFLALAAISAMITYVSQRNTGGARLPTEQPDVPIVLTICHNIVFYLGKIVWPANLTPHYDFPTPMSLANPAILMSVFGTVALLIILIVSVRWTPAWLVGWAIFFVAIFPTLGVIGFTNVIASDKYVYLPAIGLAIALAGWLSRQRRTIRTWAVGAVVVLVLSAEAWATRSQYGKWSDCVTLFGDMVERAPLCAIVHDEYGTALANVGRTTEAAAQYEEALRLMPNRAWAHNNYGTVLREMGRIDEAVSRYREAIRLNPRYLSPRINLGNVFRQQGKLDDAIRQYRSALEVDSKSMLARVFLGTAFLEQNDPVSAVNELTQAVSLDPSFVDGHVFLGMALEKAGRTKEALAAYREALRRRPHDGQIEQRVANLRVEWSPNQ